MTWKSPCAGLDAVSRFAEKVSVSVVPFTAAFWNTGAGSGPFKLTEIWSPFPMPQLTGCQRAVLLPLERVAEDTSSPALVPTCSVQVVGISWSNWRSTKPRLLATPAARVSTVYVTPPAVNSSSVRAVLHWVLDPVRQPFPLCPEGPAVSVADQSDVLLVTSRSVKVSTANPLVPCSGLVEGIV